MSRAMGYEKPGVGLGTSSSSRAFEIESWSYIQLRDYNLQIMQKVEPECTRPKIPATMWNRMSYFRLHYCALYINHFICLQFFNFNSFLWYCCCNFIFKTLPGSYVYFFLSSYAPNDHFYLSKMVPISYGMNILIVCTALIELVSASDMLFRYACVVIMGIFGNIPWNKCQEKFRTTIKGKHILCLTTMEFKQLLANGNVTVPSDFGIFRGGDGKKYELAASAFSRKIFGEIKDFFEFKKVDLLMPYMFIWIFAAACHKQLFKKYIWKVLNFTEWCMNFMFLGITLHLLYFYMETEIKPLVELGTIERSEIKLLWAADMNFLAESVTAPPVIHVLTSRSSGQINPSSDSAIMSFSNLIYFMFVQIVTYLISKYFEYYIGMQIITGQMVSYPGMYMWPLYFSTMGMGDAFTLIFFILHFILQYIVFIITYQCLLEVVLCEWRKLKWWMVTPVFTIAAFLFVVFFRVSEKMYYLTRFKAVVTLLEFCVIFLYPVGRLRDDITFHYGKSPSNFRIWSIMLIPFYYLIRVYVYIDGHLKIIFHLKLRIRHATWAWTTCFIPIVVGALYVLYQLVLKRKKNCKAMFRPVPQWGSADHIQRQLRKKFDSREYVDSQSSRYLSRYIVGKAEAHTYRLDIGYERAGRRSTVIHDAFRMDNEKKLV